MGEAQNISFGVVVLLIVVILIAVSIYLALEKSPEPNEPVHTEEKFRKANEKCQEYNEQACKLSSQSSLPTNELSSIIDGDDAVLGQFPHQAYAKFIDIKNHANDWEVLHCGGSLISEYFVLTAAQCITQAGGNPKILVLLGSLFSNMGTGRMYSVQEFHIHPNYTKERPLDNIALLKLDKKVNFASTIRPICLNTNYNIGKYHNATASGWGKTSETSGVNPRLKMVQLRIDENPKSICGEMLQKFGPYSQYMICTLNPGENKSTHAGDNGGPLQVWSTGCSNGKTTLYELLGVNTGYGKRLIPGRSRFSTFMKVEPFVPWIVDIVWP